jgi:MFS family permease
LAAVRLLAALGVGGVLYLTPMVFHRAAFDAGEVTRGVALAAAAGTVGRLASGLLLDRGRSCGLPVLLAVVAQLLGDGLLLSAHDPGGYMVGQLLMGLEMGLYWPAIELAVPLTCQPLSSGRAFALVRTADAVGVAGGALIGALLAASGQLRGIYPVDMLCLALIAGLLVGQPLPRPQQRLRGGGGSRWRWLQPLLPLLAVTLLATAMPALMQSALPLDLVSGGLARPALAESLGALVIGLQLGLLVLLQWPVGRLLARRPLRQGLAVSLLAFTAGNLLLAGSALVPHGLALLLLAQLPLALGQAAFLPTATEAVVRLCPEGHQGLAMALFSQCFAVSSLAAPLLAGVLLDSQGHAVGLWLTMALSCLAGLAPVGAIRQPPAAGPAGG